MLIPIIFSIFASTATAQQPKVPWPSQDAWDGTHCVYNAPASCDFAYLLKAKTAFIQSDIPASYSIPPAWFSKRYLIVEDPTQADLRVFVRAGDGGNANPDILMLEPNGQRVLVVYKLKPPPNSEYDPCHQWPESESAPCGLSNLSEMLTKPYVEPSNWDKVASVIENEAALEAKRAKKAEKEKKKH
jgi:hypothetical protein